MHHSETGQYVQCVECGSEISLETDRPFVLSESSALCFACALRRKGIYDEAHDRWTHAPRLAGLPLGGALSSD